MNRRFKEARQLKKMKLTETAELIGVSQPTLSSWEAGRNDPSCETLIKMAELYGVSVDYLLGRDFDYQIDHSAKLISKEELPLYHGRPVWVQGTGWALVNSTDNILRLTDGNSVPYIQDLNVYSIPPHFTEPALPEESPLKLDEISDLESVWVEPISQDLHLRNELRGWYTVKREYVENTRGNRFFFDTYSANWLAFISKA